MKSEWFWACLDCGHLWSRVDPEELKKFISKHADEATQNRWGFLAKTTTKPLADELA